jgi:type IV secretion system protein VirB10
MSSNYLRHENQETGRNLSEPDFTKIDTDATQGETSGELEPEIEDINAIAETQQRKFPIVLLLITCAIIIVLLAGFVYYVKNGMGSIAVQEKQPISSPDPLVTTKPIQINELPLHYTTIEAPGQLTTQGLPSATSAAPPQGSASCPHTPVKDPLGNPVVDSNGVPAMMDCQGRVVRTPEIVPVAQGATPAATSANATGVKGAPPNQASPTPTNRYRGPVVLGKDASADAGSLLPNAMPALPIAAADAALAAIQQQLAFPQPTTQAPTAPTQVPTASPQARSGSQGRNVAVKSIDENLVIPKGHTADCALTMRAVTEANGFAECIITANVYSANGRTLLIERFSKALGEYNVNSTAGQRVIPILWTSIRKPGGITIELSAPAVDGLGGAGLPATVDNRWGERIGGAYLLSIVKDVIAYKTAKDTSGAAAGQVYQNTTQASNDIVEKILSSTIGIRPTLYANQGDRALILFNRDVDFSGVYDVQRRSK